MMPRDIQAGSLSAPTQHCVVISPDFAAAFRLPLASSPSPCLNFNVLMVTNSLTSVCYQTNHSTGHARAGMHHTPHPVRTLTIHSQAGRACARLLAAAAVPLSAGRPRSPAGLAEQGLLHSPGNVVALDHACQQGPQQLDVLPRRQLPLAHTCSSATHSASPRHVTGCSGDIGLPRAQAMLRTLCPMCWPVHWTQNPLRLCDCSIFSGMHALAVAALGPGRPGQTHCSGPGSAAEPVHSLLTRLCPAAPVLCYPLRQLPDGYAASLNKLCSF